YCVVAALLDGGVTEKTFSNARIRDPRIAALLERTTIRENPDFTQVYPREWPCRIEVRTRGGDSKVAESRYFKGHAQDPLTDAEVEGKFRALSARALTPVQMDRIL